MNRIQKIDVRRLLLGLLMAPALAFAAADPQIASFTDSPDPINTGQDLTYTIVVANNASDVATGATLELTVGSGADFRSADCSLSASAPPTATRVTCDLGTLASGESRTITMVWRVTLTGTSVAIDATARVRADSNTNPDNDQQTQRTTVNPLLSGADVQLTSKTIASSYLIAAGDDVTFRITPRNSGPEAASSVSVTDVLPSGWTYVSASGTGWTCSAAGSTVTCTRPSLAVGVGAEADIDIVAKAPATVPAEGLGFTNGATIASATSDPVLTNNSASVSRTVIPAGADLRLFKSKLPLTVAAGTTTPLASAITVTNTGPSAATGGLRVVEVLAEETYVSSSGTGWTCTSSAGAVICDHPNVGGLAVNASLPVLTINTLATGAGSAINTACTGGSVPSGQDITLARPPVPADPNSTNDCATASSTIAAVGGSADLEVVSVVTTTPTGGDKRVSDTENSVTFTSLIRNNGTAAATGVVIVHEEPDLGSQPLIALTASVSAGSSAVFSCSSAARSCEQTGGALLAGETVTTVFTASRPLPTYGNPGVTRTFTARVSNRIETDSNPANNSKSDVYTIDSVTDLEIVSKIVNPETVASGEEATYVISLRNNGPDPARDFTVRDTFNFLPTDPGLTVVSLAYSNPSGSCTAAPVINPVANTLTCTIGYLAGGTETITLKVRPVADPVNPLLARTIGNTVVLEPGPVKDSNTANNQKTAQLTVGELDLLVNKTDTTDPVYYGEQPPPPGGTPGTYIVYTVRVTNNGPKDASNVKIAESTFVEGVGGKSVRFDCDVTGPDPATATCNPTRLCQAPTVNPSPAGQPVQFECDVPGGTLAAGTSKTMYLRYGPVADPGAGTDVYNSKTTVRSDQIEALPGNNEIVEKTTVTVRALGSGTISGKVWLDTNNDGVVGGTEAGIAGQTIELTGTSGTGVPISRSATTAADGSFTFSLVPPGSSYKLRQPAQPDGTFNGKTIAGTTGGTATGISTTPSEISGIALAAGQVSSGNNFGELRAAQLAGRVWLDANNNGVIDGAESGIAGVGLELSGTDDLGAVSRTTTTGADGSYSFTGLRPGTYAVTEPTQPTGTLNGRTIAGTAGGTATAVTVTPSAISGISLVAEQVSGGNNFGEIVPVTISGVVFVDNNDNGAQDLPADAGLSGVTITLTGTDDLGGAVTRSLTTLLDGTFSAADLRPSGPNGYTLTEPNQPPGTSNGLTVAGSAGGTATDRGTLPSVISGIVLTTPGASSANNRFAEISNSGVISGRVWLDANDDGVVNVTEAGIAGQSIELVSGGVVVGSTTTGADGSYRFEAVAPGTYTIRQPTQPANTFNGKTIAGTIAGITAGTATDPATLPSAISGIVLGVGQSSLNNNFAELGGRTISGRVWLDANNDGVVNGTEAGIAGQTIQLVSGGAVLRSTSTGADGAFAFTDVGPGTYTLVQPAQPALTFNGKTVAGTGGGTASAEGTIPSAITGIVLPGGQDAANNLFGETLGQISGRVWVDANDNGIVDGTEAGLSGVTLALSGTDQLGSAVSASAVTAADGSYSFQGLRPGTYTVTEPTQPAGTLNGQTVPGSAGGTATAATTTPSAISGIVLDAAQAIALGTARARDSSANNFGELRGQRVEGRVWLDANNNGVIDGSEGGIASVSITLSGSDALGAVSRSTTTGADGRYSFDGLRPGTYTVTEPTQPTGTLNGITVAGTRGGTATGIGTTPSAISGIVLLLGGEPSSGNNFGEIPAGRLEGRVWADANNDGQVGPSEVGLSGVTVVLDGTNDLGNAVNATRTTGADGSFSFGDLRPGTYRLTEPTQPPGTSNGVTLAGTAGGAPTPVSTIPSETSGITLNAGVIGTGYLFGEIPDSPEMLVSKSHTKAAFTVGLTGSYQIRVRNGGSVPTRGVYTVQDRLPAGLTLASPPSGTGWTCIGAAGASSFSCSSDAVIAAGETRAEAITAVVNVDAQAAAASPVSNAVLVEGGGEVPARGPSTAERDAFQNNPPALPVCAAAVTHNACRDPVVVQQAAAVSGTVWTDSGSALRVLDSGDTRLGGWLVEVVDLSSNAIVGRGTSAANGSYRISGLEPGVNLAIRFRESTSGVVFGYPINGETAPGSSGATCVDGTPAAGTTSSCVQTGATPQLVVFLASGAELPQQSLPVDPGGVVYDSVLRTPVAGAVVTLAPTGSCPGWDPNASVVAATLGGYTVSGSSISMNVGAQGQYQFLLAPTAPASCTFGLSVTPPAGYAFPSTTIVPSAGPFTPGGGVGAVVAVQPQAAPPTADPGPATIYYLALTIGSGTAGVVHNHIPVDPLAIGTLTLTKVGDRSVAEVGDSVRYTLTVTQAAAGGRPLQTTLVDRLPAGFTYIAGTASVNGVPIADPAGGVGPVLAFNLGVMPTERQLVLRYRVRVGVGSQQGDGINRALGHACNLAAGCVDPSFNPLPNSTPTNPAQFRVRVLGGVFTTEACVLGKIFVDCNNNHLQDSEELGIPGVRLVLSDGTLLISDSEGKVSLCGLPPRSHVLRVDPSTLPRGSRLTTSSNRNLGDAGSLWLDLKNGELHRADFIEGSCSNTVLEQVKARRAQGEVRSVQSEKKGGPALRFDSKAHGLDTLRSPQQGTDGANQQAPKPRATTPTAPAPAQDETHVPTPNLPMNQPPPQGRTPGDPPDSQKAAGASADGGSHGTR